MTVVPVPPACHAIVTVAQAEGRATLYEHEGYALLEAYGLRCPRRLFVPSARPGDPRAPWAETLERAVASLDGDRLVVKAVSQGLPHKSDAGGVRIVPRNPGAVSAAVSAMDDGLAAYDLAGVLLVEYVAHGTEPGSEFLLAAQMTAEYGAVVTVAPGGRHAEFLAAHLREGEAIAAIAAGAVRRPSHDALASAAWVRLATTPQRGAPPRLPAAALADAVERMLALASGLEALGLQDCEINPAVVSDGGFVALDALVTLGSGHRHTPARPTTKLRHVLVPESIAVIGVSDGVNVGRVVLRNILRAGFSPDRVFVVKPGRGTIEGCRAVPSLVTLPHAVGLLVVAIPAPQVPALIEEVVGTQRAEGIIVLTGGLDETAEGATHASRMRDTLDTARTTPWGGPLVVGGNCLGVRSRPGRYDTMFIPGTKLPVPAGGDDPVALIAQSGAFAAARASRWTMVSPRYVVTLGNQVDVTIGDVVEWLRDDPDVMVFALYVEGFKTADGLRTLRAADEITRSGRSVVLYRAGRTPAGVRASASHTASIAGDYRLTRVLFEQSGVMVADTMDAFDDFVLLSLALRHVPAGGRRVAVVSNAGFECVAAADWLGSLELATLRPQTCGSLASLFAELRIASIVDVHNPLDLTPMTTDAGYEAVLRCVLGDEGVDAAVVGCVPLTPALQTLPATAGAGEDLMRPDAVAGRLGRLRAECGKPFVVAVDAGPRFDPLADALRAAGVPTFRSAVGAVRALDAWTCARLGRP